MPRPRAGIARIGALAVAALVAATTAATASAAPRRTARTAPSFSTRSTPSSATERPAPSRSYAMRTTVPAGGQQWGLGLIETPHRCGPSWGHGGETLGYETNADSSANGNRQAVVAINADQSVLATRRVQMAISRLNELAYCG
jgi:hypothetical protein